MQKEFIKKIKNKITLNVTDGKIDSFREQEEETNTVRLYENGIMGVAGCLGQADEELLTSKAIEALSLNIKYPCKLEGKLEKEILNEKEIISVSNLIPTMQDFLHRLNVMCPNFAFSNKISLIHNKSEYTNSLGRHLISSVQSIDIQLLSQNRGSGNLFDTTFSYDASNFNPEELLDNFKKEYDAFYVSSDIEPGEYPVVIDATDLFGSFLQQFVAELYVAGASLLSGKLCEKAFSEKLTLKNDMNPTTNPSACFFDDEGCVAPDLRPTLIEKGTLTGLLTTKKSSDNLKIPNLGTAASTYDGVLCLGFNKFYVEPTVSSLKELVPGKAIYIVITSGGDVTPDGHFASPVQMSYLMENGEIIGRLPEIHISGNFYDLFGKNYIGSVRNNSNPSSTLSVLQMTIKK